MVLRRRQVRCIRWSFWIKLLLTPRDDINLLSNSKQNTGAFITCRGATLSALQTGLKLVEGSSLEDSKLRLS